jgi:hypothetical protein
MTYDLSGAWGDPCDGCQHAMREHVLDWDTGTDLECTHDDCHCPEFRPRRWKQYPIRAQSE